MEKKELSDLIDQYLLGNIQPKDFARLEYLKKTNPAIDHEIETGIEAVRVLRYLRYKELRDKLRKIDEVESAYGKKIISHRWLFCTLIALISFSGLGLWSWYHFKSASIALRYFHQLADTQDSPAYINDELVINWKAALKAMDDQQFDEAIILFKPFAESHSNEVSFAAEWDILIARYALNGYDDSWRKELIQFKSTAPEPFKSACMKLLRTIDSPFYKFFILKMSTQISTFKPRLM